ncbi:Cof-type HAD-IIB family hydrolase [Anaerocolumna chitinilytica]|uniref:Haloacid dehalogenase n=1 Tax=Anaerocolumna chitinilytica TaxID=1727145 RepID=A0A7I8DPW5_9FIRM|nr:Cof-type HAD-IIB family hydrolase [Anaerocolumna chitinilytica]BCK00459.1 haloacid dehalogenase [Anaerocolumna chitinilytica]
MAYEILVLDIDGTLTNSQKEISPKTYRSIMAIQERGHSVVLASGRPTPGILPLAKKLKLSEYNGYILSYNGAKVMNCKDGEVIFQQALNREYLPDLHLAAMKNNVGMISYEGDCVITDSKIDKYMELEARINGIPIKQVQDFISYVQFDINKCLMTGDPDVLKEMEPELKNKFIDNLSIYRSEPFFLEIMPKNIDKAYSLGKLLDYLGLSKEQMISCGDGYNDISMIEYAGMGVAMANAQDAVKNKANYITYSNDEDGIAHVIETFML